MDTTIQPNMKPVPVQRVSDDIRDLRKGDVAQQQTVLTARAVADIFRGDTVVKSSAFDAKYFDGDKVDLDLIIDSGCRHIAEGTYINGPKYAVREEETGDQTPYGGFLYTLGVLPTGELYWGPQEFPKTAEDIEITSKALEVEAYRGTPNGDHEIEYKNELPIGSPIRQLFFVDNDDQDEPQSYTRVGRYESYVDVTGQTQFRYKWGNWMTLNGETQYIVVTDARMEEVVNPITNAVYSVHTNIPRFDLPDANTQKLGSTIKIIQHPDPNSEDRQLWATNVVYEYGTEGEADYEKMQITCTPAPRRNTVRTEEAYKEGLVPTEYVFEVAPRMDDASGSATIIGNTWHLKVDADETEFTTGIVELLDAHTELGIRDIIDYSNRKYSADSGAYSHPSKQPLYINRSVCCDGFLKFTISKNDLFKDKDWILQIKRFDSRNPVNFFPTKDVAPDPYKTYFTKVPYESSAAEGVFKIAIIEDGRFDCTIQYYEIDPDSGIEDLLTLTSDSLTPGVPVHYQHKVYRNDIVYVVITPGLGDGSKGHIDARGNIFPVLSFVPDPHPGSYVSKEEMDGYGFSAKMFELLKDNGLLPKTATTEDTPANLQAIISGYTDLAGKLQKRGLLMGAAFLSIHPDDVKEGGVYWIPEGLSEPTGYPLFADKEKGARLVVFGQDYALQSVTHELDQYFITSDTSVVEGKTYYTFDPCNKVMTACPGLIDFKTGIVYYESDTARAPAHTADVTQLFIQDTTIWMRSYSHWNDTWSEWACLTGGSVARSFTSPDAYQNLDLSAEKLRNWMMLGELTLFCGITLYSEVLPRVQEIHLPEPSSIPFGKKLILAIAGAYGSKVRISYTRVDESTERAYIYSSFNGDGITIDNLELMSDGTYWYYKADASKYTRIDTVN